MFPDWTLMNPVLRQPSGKIRSTHYVRYSVDPRTSDRGLDTIVLGALSSYWNGNPAICSALVPLTRRAWLKRMRLSPLFLLQLSRLTFMPVIWTCRSSFGWSDLIHVWAANMFFSLSRVLNARCNQLASPLLQGSNLVDYLTITAAPPI